MNIDNLRNVGSITITNEVLKEDIFNMIDLLYKFLFKKLSKDIFEKTLSVYSNKLDDVLEYNNKSVNSCKLYNDVLHHLHSAEFVNGVSDKDQTKNDVYSKYMPVIQDIFYDKSEVSNNLNYISAWLHTYEILISIYEEDSNAQEN